MKEVPILVLDFGSQYTQLIARKLRESGVYCEIVPYNEKIEDILNLLIKMKSNPPIWMRRLIENES